MGSDRSPASRRPAASGSAGSWCGARRSECSGGLARGAGGCGARHRHPRGGHRNQLPRHLASWPGQRGRSRPGRTDLGAREWTRRMKESLRHISPQFDCRRMVREYMTQLYDPAHIGHQRVSGENYRFVRERIQWIAKIREAWDRVRFVDAGPAPTGSITALSTSPLDM